MTEPSESRYALVTGGGSGLGKAFCLRLAAEGWHVACSDVDLAAAEQTVNEIEAAGGQAQAEHLDVVDSSQWQDLRERLAAEWPRLDLLINNAGICGTGEVGDSPLEDFQRILDINLRGTINGCHTMIPWLKESAAGGQIVNISSIASVVSAPSMAAYNVSKAGVLSLSETLYAELRPWRIGVTVVLPGFFASQLTKRGLYHTDMQRNTADHYTNRSSITAEKVVEQTLRALRKRKFFLVVGRRAVLSWRFKRLASITWLNLVDKIYRRHQRKFDAGD